MAISSPVSDDAKQDRPLALVYRGDAVCDDCSDAVAALLEKSPRRFNVTFCGPDEDVDLSPDLLAQAAVYAFPGGPGKSLSFGRLASDATNTSR
jgi:hypothetical protein